MTVSASQAYLMTQNSATVQAADKVAQEVTFAEQRVLNTTTYGLYHIVYSAMLIGNPQGDPNVDANLSSNQLAFRNALQSNGYLIGRDASSGYWTISWDQNGPEAVVSVYRNQRSSGSGIRGNYRCVGELFHHGTIAARHSSSSDRWYGNVWNLLPSRHGNPAEHR